MEEEEEEEVDEMIASIGEKIKALERRLSDLVGEEESGSIETNNQENEFYFVSLYIMYMHSDSLRTITPSHHRTVKISGI